jgi:hypothetical protein
MRDPKADPPASMGRKVIVTTLAIVGLACVLALMATFFAIAYVNSRRPEIEDFQRMESLKKEDPYMWLQEGVKQGARP